MIIFASRDFHSIFLNSVPPNGVVTISFMILGSFMLFLGIISFLKSAVRDKEFYRAINNKIETDTELLKNIIISEKEKDLAKKIKPLMEYSRKWQEEHEYKDMKIDEITQIIRDVILQLQQNKKNSLFQPNNK